MSADLVNITVPVTVNAAVEQWAIELLTSRGYRVELGEPAGDWITPAALRRSFAFEIDDNTFLKRLNSPEAPSFTRRRGGSGRITKLRPTASLVAWLSRPLAS